MTDILPPNSTALERALAATLDPTTRLDAAIRRIRTAKRIDIPDRVVPYLVWEYGLGELLPWLSPRRAIAEGVPWQRLRGTPQALATALSWIAVTVVRLDEGRRGPHWPDYQIELGDVPACPTVADIVRLARLSAPVRSRLTRLYNAAYDRRPMVLDRDQLDGGSLLDDSSGVRWTTACGPAPAAAPPVPPFRLDRHRLDGRARLDGDVAMTPMPRRRLFRPDDHRLDGGARLDHRAVRPVRPRPAFALDRHRLDVARLDAAVIPAPPPRAPAPPPAPVPRQGLKLSFGRRRPAGVAVAGWAAGPVWLGRRRGWDAVHAPPAAPGFSQGRLLSIIAAQGLAGVALSAPTRATSADAGSLAGCAARRVGADRRWPGSAVVRPDTAVATATARHAVITGARADQSWLDAYWPATPWADTDVIIEVTHGTLSP